MRCVTDKQKMNVRRTILFLAAAAFLTGCFKDVSTTTNYVIKPLVQDLSGDPYLALDGVKAYAFDADTAAWYIASYDDAVAGKITSKDDDSFTRSNPNFTAYKEEGSSLYKMQVSTGTLMVVVVDRVDRLYAYTKKEVDLEGAPPTFSVLFRPWVQQWIDTEEPNGWIVVNPGLDPDKDSQTQTQPRRR